MTESIKTASSTRAVGGSTPATSCWLADSILSDSPGQQSVSDRSVGAITGAFFRRRPGIQIAPCGVAQVGSSPGGSWQWRLLLVASWITCVESQVKTPINKSEGGEGIGNGAPMPDGLARRTALTRILQTPTGLRPGAPVGGGQSTVLIAGNRMPLA